MAFDGDGVPRVFTAFVCSTTGIGSERKRPPRNAIE
jgi:hypothetical protein